MSGELTSATRRYGSGAPVRANVCRGDPKAARRWDAVEQVTVAPRRGFCEDQGPAALALTGRRSCAALRELGFEDKQETGRWENNRAENSHQPFRRRERATLRFRRMRTLQKFASVHASIHNHFNQERYLYGRRNFKANRIAALAEWRQLCSA